MARRATGRRMARNEAYRERRAELDAIRRTRRLTPDEQAEADILANREYHRQWRAVNCPRVRKPGPPRLPHNQRIETAARS
ncbi:hypothetical protein [Novosphingobium aquae]|uniref:Uncharacterized protein n=1 Tax=Novosphingobium aquae TaxID=3133435 RepID=A0ABU8S407_9SPHN